MRTIAPLLLVVGVVLGLVAPPAAGQVVPGESVDVILTRMTPLNPQPSGTLRMAGRLRNRTDDDIVSIQVRLLLSSTPLATRSEIGATLLGTTDGDGPPTLAVSEPIPLLGPRGTADWSLDFPLDDLPLGLPGVYVAGAEVIGTGPDGLPQRLGLTRTFLPWYPEGSTEALRLVWLWPVTGTPDRALDSLQLSEQAAAEMAPGGRLARIVRAGAGSRVTWAMDPNVLQTAAEMAQGYEVVGERGSPPSTGAGSPLAEEWLADVRAATRDSATVAVPYALPDAEALQRSEMGGVAAEATRAAAAAVREATGGGVDEVLAWPVSGFTTPRAARTYRRAGAAGILMADTAWPATPALTYTPDGFTTWRGLPVVLADSGLKDALRMPQDSRSQSLLARQRFLAEVAMASGELPESRRSIVAAGDPLWAPASRFLRQTLRALDQAPYARLTRLPAAQRAAQEVPRTRLSYPPELRDAELPRDYLASVKRQRRVARRFQAVLTQPADLGYDRAVARQASALWRGRQGTGEDLIRAVSGQLSTLTGQVRIPTTGTFTLPGDTGRIPVTVANDLDQDVVVGIRLETDEPARLTAADVEPFEVPAGRKVSLEVEAKVVGSGTLPVRLQLTTPTGRRYGQPAPVEVRTTAYSRAAAYVVSGAFVLLAFLLGMNFVRRRRAARLDAR